MSITLAPETERWLRELARSEGRDIDAVANEMLLEMLADQKQDFEDAVEGIRRGLDDCQAGRVRPWAEVAAEMRVRLAANR